MTGGIMRLANYRGWTVNIRAPKWKDNQLWINSLDLEAAQYIADAAFHFTGRPPVHFPDVKFDYLPLLLSTGERLTTREKCSAYVAKIAKGPALLDRRKDFKERAQKLILEMVKIPEVVRFLRTVRASPRQAWQPRHEANPEDTDSPCIEDENGTAMEVDSVTEEAIQALAPTGTVDPAAVFQFDSSMTSFYVDVDMSRAFIPSFDIDLFEPENFLTSAGQSLGVWHPRFGEKKEDLVPDNCKELLASLDKGEEEIWKSIELGAMESSPSIYPTVAAFGYYCSRIRMAEPRHYLRCGCHRSFATPCEAHFVSEQMEALRHSGDCLMPREQITIP